MCRGCVNVAVGPKIGYMRVVGRMVKKLLGFSYPNIYKPGREGMYSQ